MKSFTVLKNISDKTFRFEVTENPLLSGSNSQFSIREDDNEVNELQTKTQKEIIERTIKKNPALKERLSTLYKVVFQPGEKIRFGKGSKYNLEQAEYLYRQLGGYAEDGYGQEVVQPIIELAEDGTEDKTGFYKLYRQKKSIDVARMPFLNAKEQFNVPVAPPAQEKPANVA